MSDRTCTRRAVAAITQAARTEHDVAGRIFERHRLAYPKGVTAYDARGKTWRRCGTAARTYGIRAGRYRGLPQRERPAYPRWRLHPDDQGEEQVTDTPKVRISDPGGVLSIIPLVMGYQPSDGDLVLLGLRERGRLAMTMRVDAAAVMGAGAGELRQVVQNAQRNDVRSAILVGYGNGETVTPAMDRLVPLAAENLVINDAVRVEGNRYWSYNCTDPGCCPAGGREFAAETEATTTLRTEGFDAAPSREALAARIAAPQDELGEAAQQAWDRALREPVDVDAGRLAVQQALASCRAGKRLDDDGAARLAAAMRELPVRDDAWARMAPEHADQHLALWSDVVRRVPDAGAAAPATLLAWCAWQKGDGTLANVAVDRALEAQPGYSMATLVGSALSAGAPPSIAVPPMTPAEVAQSYGVRVPPERQPEIEHSELEAGG